MSDAQLPESTNSEGSWSADVQHIAGILQAMGVNLRVVEVCKTPRIETTAQVNCCISRAGGRPWAAFVMTDGQIKPASLSCGVDIETCRADSEVAIVEATYVVLFEVAGCDMGGSRYEIKKIQLTEETDVRRLLGGVFPLVTRFEYSDELHQAVWTLEGARKFMQGRQLSESRDELDSVSVNGQSLHLSRAGDTLEYGRRGGSQKWKPLDFEDLLVRLHGAALFEGIPELSEGQAFRLALLGTPQEAAQYIRERMRVAVAKYWHGPTELLFGALGADDEMLLTVDDFSCYEVEPGEPESAAEVRSNLPQGSDALTPRQRREVVLLLQRNPQVADILRDSDIAAIEVVRRIGAMDINDVVPFAVWRYWPPNGVGGIDGLFAGDKVFVFLSSERCVRFIDALQRLGGIKDEGLARSGMTFGGVLVVDHCAVAGSHFARLVLEPGRESDFVFEMARMELDEPPPRRRRRKAANPAASCPPAEKKKPSFELYGVHVKRVGERVVFSPPERADITLGMPSGEVTFAPMRSPSLRRVVRRKPEEPAAGKTDAVSSPA